MRAAGENLDVSSRSWLLVDNDEWPASVARRLDGLIGISNSPIKYTKNSIFMDYVSQCPVLIK